MKPHETDNNSKTNMVPFPHYMRISDVLNPQDCDKSDRIGRKSFLT